MKTREITDIIRNRGMEKGVIHVLEALNEEHQQTRRDIREMAQMFDQMMETLTGVVTIAGNMKNVLDTGMRETDLGASTQAIARGDE